MTEQKENSNSREIILGLLIILLSSILNLIFPLIAPVIGVVLLINGIFTYRKSKDITMRTKAVTFIVGGAMILLMIFLASTFLLRVGSTSSSIQVGRP
jgi:hypothetical protein